MVGTPINAHGIYSALFTPSSQTGVLDTTALRNLIRYELNHGVEGLYCCGSSGEGLLLDKEERMAIVEVVSQEVNGTIPFIVHTGSLGTKEAILLSQHAQESGASAVSLIPPIYYNYNQNEISGYYQDVMDAIDLGVIVYNIPQYTGISFSKENATLLSDQIVGIKHTSMNLYELERINQAFSQKILFNGFDEIWLYSLTAGASATIGTTVNICPSLFKEIKRSYGKGDLEEAKRLQSLLNEFIEALVKINVFPAAKYCMTLLGVDIGPCRKPFDALTDGQKSSIKTALDRLSDYL